MIDPRAIADRVVDEVGGDAEAEVWVESGVLALTRFANSFIHQNVAEESATTTLRVVKDGRSASATTTATGDDAVRELISSALDAARLQPVDDGRPPLIDPVEAPHVEHCDEETFDAPPGQRAERVRAFVEAGDGMLAAGYCETAGSEVAFSNSRGQRLSGRASRALLDGIHQTPSSAGSAHQASSRIGDIDGTAVGGVAAGRARASTGPFDLKPGEYEVVLAPECVATIGLFLGVYGFNAKVHAEDQSFAEVGSTQFDAALSMWDDATDPRALGVPFDTEGTPKRRVDLVRSGVTTGLAHDRRTAAATGIESTAHHGPGAAVHGPVPTNLFVGAGGEPVEALIAGVEHGLYVSTFNYCRILDPKSQVVTGLTRNGTFMIENGAVTGAVTNLRFTQSFVAALAPGRVLGVADDDRLADSDFGPGMAHVPSMRLAAWNFTGGAGG